MLIGNWCKLGSNYHLVINEHKLNLEKLNSHVLQCFLPKFDQIYLAVSQQSMIKDNDDEPELFIPNTFIYIYENDLLYCPPLPFEIKCLKNKLNNSLQTSKFSFYRIKI